MAKESAAGGVQSVERSALLLDVLARAGGRAAPAYGVSSPSSLFRWAGTEL